MAYHILVLKKDLNEYIPRLKSERLPDSTMACFHYFASFYSPITSQGLCIYIGLILDRKVEKLFEDFNSKFSNIKIQVKFKRKFTEYTNAEQVAREYIIYPCTEIIEKLDVHVLSLKFSKDYLGKARYHMYVPIIQFLRMFSPMNRYVPHYNMVMKVEPKIKAILEGHANYQWRSDYGSWCSLGVTLEEFMMLDDPEFMNRVTQNMNTHQYYGTQLFGGIKTELAKKQREEIEHNANI